MSFRDLAKRVRASAAQLGIRASMSQLNDAIAVACYGKRYTAVLAAEGVGKLPPLPRIPPNITKAARQFHIDTHAFGLALHAGMDQSGPRPSGNTVGDAVDWLAEQHPAEFEAFAQEELFGLVEPELAHRALSAQGLAAQMLMTYAELVIADAIVQVDGKPRRAIELLRDGYSRSLPDRQNQYLEALAITPLRLYLIDSVQPGYSMRLRELGREIERTVTILERSGSRPDMQGQTLATRIVPIDNHFEMAGGTLTFTHFAMTSLVERLRHAHSDAEVSREIRTAWFQQFGEHRRPQFVTAGEGDAMRLIVDTYQCRDLNLLASRLNTAGVKGDSERGWSIKDAGTDGQHRQMCGVHIEDHESGLVTAFYESEQRAERYRPRFEQIAGDVIEHIERTSEDPLEAAMKMDEREARHLRGKVTPDQKTEALRAFFYTNYAGWSDKPLPFLDNLTPVQMLATPGGEVRVREILAIYESRERGMAEEEKREPVSFDFLYRSVGLEPENQPAPDHYEGAIRPDQFYVNEAWVVFRFFDEAVQTTEGEVDMLGLMDASSTCILNTHPITTNHREISQLDAKRFLTQLKVPMPPRPARKLLLPATLEAPTLEAEATRLGMKIFRVHEDDLLPICGEARASIGAHFMALTSQGR